MTNSLFKTRYFPFFFPSTRYTNISTENSDAPINLSFKLILTNAHDYVAMYVILRIQFFNSL